MPLPLVLLAFAAYFALLLTLGWWTGRRARNAGYFLGNRNSPWLVVAIGLLSDSLSGVTFISVPGEVGQKQFGYFQVVLGYAAGYLVIAHVLLPLYYRMQLTSIYTYLGTRFGANAERTGSFFFLLSRLTGAAARLYLAATVLHAFLLGPAGIPFTLTVAVILGLILLYTLRGGIKTLVWTDALQSLFLLGGLVLAVLAMARALDLPALEAVRGVLEGERSRIFFWDWRAGNYFWKEFLGGMAIAVVMTGLDQNSMQKNLSCRSLGSARKNLYCFTGLMLAVNYLFLVLGALLFQVAEARGLALPKQSDHLFPTLALGPLGPAAGMAFLLGLVAATFSSADSVLTTLTTSFGIDMLGWERRVISEEEKARSRRRIHVVFAVVLFGVILLFEAFSRMPVIRLVLGLATFTYGPLLGLFLFGLASRRAVPDAAIPWICAAAPLLTWAASEAGPRFFQYTFGFELLLVNGLLTCLGLRLLSRPALPGAGGEAPVRADRSALRGG